MKKYKVFRSFGNLDKNVRKHELVGVEYGENIDALTNRLIKVVCDDAAGLDKFQKGYTALAYAPEPVEDYRRVKQYAYLITAVISPEYGETNILIEYGVTEENTVGE